HQLEQRLVVAGRRQIMLPQPNQVFAQLAFYLLAMQAHGHLETLEEVVSKQYLVTNLDVGEFDREDVRRAAEFLGAEHKRSRMSFARPPNGRRVQLLEGRAIHALQDAQHVQVRM